MNSLVSIITPSYNSKEFIKDTIDSVLAQSYKNWEMIIVDDCSSDNSVDYIFSQGVIHHTSYPEKILSELYRVLKLGGKAKIMVYNYDSPFVHQYIAYYKITLLIMPANINFRWLASKYPYYIPVLSYR